MHPNPPSATPCLSFLSSDPLPLALFPLPPSSHLSRISPALPRLYPQPPALLSPTASPMPDRAPRVAQPLSAVVPAGPARAQSHLREAWRPLRAGALIPVACSRPTSRSLARALYPAALRSTRLPICVPLSVFFCSALVTPVSIPHPHSVTAYHPHLAHAAVCPTNRESMPSQKRIPRAFDALSTRNNPN